MSAKEAVIWLEMMKVYQRWERKGFESQMMPISLLAEKLKTMANAEEILAVLEKGIVAHLVEFQVGQTDSYFYPLFLEKS